MARLNRQTGKAEPYAYIITDRAFPDFKVLNTANGWWLDKGKVENLLNAYKIDANDDEACSYAGISIDQLKYFKGLHPEFSAIKQACGQILGIKAKKALAAKIEENPEWYLEHRRREEYSTRQEISDPEREKIDEQTKKLNEMIELMRSWSAESTAHEPGTGTTEPDTTGTGGPPGGADASGVAAGGNAGSEAAA